MTAVTEALTGELMPRVKVPARGNIANFGDKRLRTGRPKGIPNKLTREVKDVIAKCFSDIGGAAEFAKWARNNRTEFYKLYSKMLPIQLQGSGAGGKIEVVISAADSKL